MKAVHLQTEHLENPLGLQTVRPVFSWHTDGGLQSAYEIIVRNGKTAVWKSGKVTTGRMLARCGYDAAPREHLTWRIRLWDENDHPGEWNALRVHHIMKRVPMKEDAAQTIHYPDRNAKKLSQNHNRMSSLFCKIHCFFMGSMIQFFQVEPGKIGRRKKERKPCAKPS